MRRFTWSPRFWFVAVAVLSLVLDQASKMLILASRQMHTPHNIFGDALRFFLTMNERGLFGMSYGPKWMHYVLPIIVVVFVIWFAWKSADRWSSIAFGLILGGGVANNLIDRVRFGAVVDFIDMGIGNTRWYTYNLADAFAVAGVIMILTHEFFGWGRAKPAATTNSSASPSGQN